MWSRPSTRRARAISSTPASSGRCSPGSSSSRPFGSPTRPRRFSARVSAVAGRLQHSRRRAPLPVSEATAMDPSLRAAPRAAPPSPMSSSLSELVARLERALEAAAPVRVAGLRGSGPALCLARLLARRPRAALVLAATGAEAEAFAADLRFLLGDGAAAPPPARRVHYLPGWEVPPFEPLSPTRETVAARAEGLYHLVHTLAPVVVTTAEAWALRCLPRTEFAAAVTYVVAGETIAPDALVARLVEWGYHRVPLVQDPGDLALRGGILDVFPVGYGEPARLEFMGDAIESMRAFGPPAQRSLGAVDELLLLPLAEFGRARVGPESARAIDERAAELGLARRERRELVEAVRTGLVLPGTEFLLPYFYADLGRMADYLPADTVLWLQAPAEVEAAAEAGWVQVEAHAADATREGRFHPPPERLYLPPAVWREGLAGRPRVEAEAIDVLDDAALVAPSYSTDGLALRDPAAPGGPLAAVAVQLAGWQRQGARLVVVATGAAQRERIRELLAGHDVDAGPSGEPFPQAAATPGRKPLALVGGLTRGVWLPADALALVTEAEIFGERRQIRRGRRARAAGVRHGGRSLPGVRGTLPVRGDAGPAAGDRRRARRPRARQADGPAGVRRRRLRQDRGGHAGRLSRRARGEAGGGAGADDGARAAAPGDLPGPPRGLSGDRRRPLPLPVARREQTDDRAPADGPPRRRDRDAPAPPEGRRLPAARPPDRRRGASLRGPPQGAHPPAARDGRRADPDGHTHPPHAQHGALRHPRSQRDRDAAARPAGDPQ